MQDLHYLLRQAAVPWWRRPLPNRSDAARQSPGKSPPLSPVPAGFVAWPPVPLRALLPTQPLFGSLLVRNTRMDRLLPADGLSRANLFS